MRQQRDAQVGRDPRVRWNAELETPADVTDGDAALDLGEGVADARARTAAERKVGEPGQSRRERGCPPLGSKRIRLFVEALRPMHRPLWNHDLDAGPDGMTAKLAGLHGGAADPVGGRIQAQRLTHDAIDLV